MAPEMATASPNLTSSLRENRVFPPPAAFAASAHIGSLEEYREIYRRSVEQPEEFWAGAARELDWFHAPKQVLEGETHQARWFADGTLNMSVNCVDRHVAAGRGAHAAIVWEGEPGEVRTLTFADLQQEVTRCASMLRSLGVGKGDRVAIYMGMTPEVAVAMLACTRIGAVHSVIFGGFAPQAIADRILDSDCRVILTQDATWRRGAEIRLKGCVDEALKRCPDVRHAVVLKRTGAEVAMQPGRDLWWHDAMAAAEPTCPPEELNAEDPLFILYTSGNHRQAQGPRSHQRRLRRADLPHHKAGLRSAPG